MSLGKILEKYHASFKELEATLGIFFEQATEINKQLVAIKTRYDEVRKAQSDCGQHMHGLLDQAKNLKTDGIVQLNDVKSLLVLAASHPSKPHSIKAEEIAALANHPDASVPVWNAFVKSAAAINGKLFEIERQWAEGVKAELSYNKHVIKAFQAAHGLNTHGIVQLDELKKLLILASDNPANPKPIDISEVKSLYQEAAQQIEMKCNKKIDAYLTQNAGTWPGEIKPGMVFLNKGKPHLIEITNSTKIIEKTRAAAPFKAKILKDYESAPKETAFYGDDLSAKHWVLVKTG